MCETLPIHYCPRCGAKRLQVINANAIHCDACDFHYFHNNAAAAGVVIRCAGHVLLVERGRDPGKGSLSVPGGFVDYGESAEQAARREVREEVGLQLDDIDYLASFPNTYRFADVIYKTCDIYFQARVPERPVVVVGDDAVDFVWLRPSEIRPEQIVFESVGRLIGLLQEQG